MLAFWKTLPPSPTLPWYPSSEKSRQQGRKWKEILTGSPSRVPDGMGRNKHVQTPWGRGGRQRNLWPCNLGAHAGLELWQVKTQDQTEPGSLVGGGGAQCPGGARPQCQKAGGMKSVPLTRRTLWTDLVSPWQGLAGSAELTPTPLRMPQKPGRAPSPAPAHFPPNPISTAQCFQLPRPSLQSPAAPSLRNPPKGPAASEFPSPAGPRIQQPPSFLPFLPLSLLLSSLGLRPQSLAGGAGLSPLLARVAVERGEGGKARWAGE